MWIITVIMFTSGEIGRCSCDWHLLIIPCMASTQKIQSQKCSAKKWWYPMCLVTAHIAEKLVAVTRRLIYFPTVTALKPNCPWVSWLSPTQLSCCRSEKTELTSHAQTSKGLFPGKRQNYYQADSGVFTKLVGIVHWIEVLLLLYHKIMFPFTLVHYHARAPANILYLLPTYVRVLFNSCGWGRGSAFPGCNPLSYCRKGLLRDHTASCKGKWEHKNDAVLFILNVPSASSWNSALLLLKMFQFSKKKKKNNARIMKIAHFLSF